MKQTTLFLIIFLLGSFLKAQTGSSKKTEVLMLGTFHFANPGLDIAKFEDANIMSEKRQREVALLVEQLKQFKPDKIFIEAPVSAQKRFDSLFLAYKAGTHKLGRNESQQLGFRLAEQCGLNSLYCVDYTDVSFPMDSAIKIMMSNKQMDMLQYLQGNMQKEQNDFNEQLKTKTLTQILLDGNTENVYRKLAGVYYFFLKVGDKNNHIGSFIASEQWRRNIYIYENILKNLDGNEQRILVLFGTTHIAMIKEMMQYNEMLNIVPVSTVLH